MAGYSQAGWLKVGYPHAGVKVTDTLVPATDLQTGFVVVRRQPAVGDHVV
jgi:hypothetical protein